MYDSIRECMQTCLALKDSIAGDELGTFMGSMVTTISYNVTYSNSDLHRVLIGNSFANLVHSMFGQICNNIVTHISLMECGTTTLWTKSYKISMWQLMMFVLLGILGITVAPRIPHVIKIMEAKVLYKSKTKSQSLWREAD
ncbi:hypothetical protein DY000_02027115 [Brassica cretica]|uniref:Cation-transporting P-type ATPase C-terminal domain-containing protein n=1 Tax=Brassica cretica TaxID=69181 RepID=A0ABQ7ELN5_BRACR|nr:hypothetical protein DY000_02027115 [Brassica cretica]